MDPLTQATLGAALPASTADKRRMDRAITCGLLGGLAPDLDVLIRSGTDPLLFLEYHRQFTHSLAFIPVGSALVALCIWLLLGRRRDWPIIEIFGFTLLGFGTHALLDACTSYGTQLLWPFSNARIAWDVISIIDPLFTGPLLLAVLLARWRQHRGWALAGMGWAMLYLGAGFALRNSAIATGEVLAANRGHTGVEVSAKPSFANIVLWKTLYRHGDRYYVDAARVLGDPIVYEGQSITALDVERDFPWLRTHSLQARDIERFRWFSNGYLSADPRYPNRIMDLRYSLLPNEIRPLWSIELSEHGQDTEHVRYLTHREDADRAMQLLLQQIRGSASEQ